MKVVCGLRGLATAFAMFVFCTAAVAVPKAVIEPTQIDLGTLKVGETGKSSFTIRNDGDENLEITKIQLSCPSCIVLGLDKEDPLIPPGASRVFPVEYNSEGKYGAKVATIAISTNDPAMPSITVDVEVFVKAVILTQPDKVVEFSIAPRGYELKKTLTISAAEKNIGIEVLDLRMVQPTMTVQIGETTIVNEQHRMKLKFTLDAHAPLGELKNTLLAKVRVGTDETQLRMPVMGTVVGDVVVLPPAIYDPVTAYAQGERISQIYVWSSVTGARCPKVLGVLTVGPLTAAVQPVPAENKYEVVVNAADTAPGGPRSGTVYVMTASKDQPIVAVPVLFKVEKPLFAEPENLVFSMANGSPPGQRVKISSRQGKPFMIKEVRYETDLLRAKLVAPSPTSQGPAELELVPTGIVDPARAAAMAVVVTDYPGAEEFLIPVLLQP